MTEQRCPECLGSGLIYIPTQTVFIRCPCWLEKTKIKFLESLPKLGVPVSSDSKELQKFLTADPLKKSIYFSGDSYASWGFIRGALRELYSPGIKVVCCNLVELAERFVNRGGESDDDRDNTRANEAYRADLLIFDLCSCPMSTKYNQIMTLAKDNRERYGLSTWAVRRVSASEFNNIYLKDVQDFLGSFEQIQLGKKGTAHTKAPTEVKVAAPPAIPNLPLEALANASPVFDTSLESSRILDARDTDEDDPNPLDDERVTGYRAKNALSKDKRFDKPKSPQGKRKQY